ncbi:hypothetical protein ACXZ3T_003777, partial [Escherichia coli]
AARGSIEQKLASAASVTKEQKLCCVSSMEGGGTEYPGTSDGKPPKPGVSRKCPDRMLCFLGPARPCLFQGKPALHKGTGGQGKTKYLSLSHGMGFFPSGSLIVSDIGMITGTGVLNFPFFSIFLCPESGFLLFLLRFVLTISLYP